VTAEPADEFEVVARLSELPDGTLLAVQRKSGERLCLFNLRGEIGAVSDNCTHQDFPLSEGILLPDGTLECVWHGARFDCATGAVRKQPATEPLPVYAVMVRDGQIYVGGRKR
jgi:nitrite reductase/ring-hydroxylating ferredoxin subunit